MGIRYGKKLLKAYRENPTQFQKQETGKGASAKVFFADKHKEWYSANVMMALVAAGSWVAHILGDLTPINYSISTVSFSPFSFSFSSVFASS